MKRILFATVAMLALSSPSWAGSALGVGFGQTGTAVGSVGHSAAAANALGIGAGLGVQNGRNTFSTGLGIGAAQSGAASIGNGAAASSAAGLGVGLGVSRR